MRTFKTFSIAIVGSLALAACEPAPDTEQAAAPGNDDRMAAGGDVVVYKSPTCGCCSGWIDHMRANGFEVEGVDLVQYADLTRKKAELGVPRDLGSCHTGRVGGYTIEGHVPAEVVARLLREQPEDIVGLSVPGMPIGSPGMEGPNPEAYQVFAFDAEGNRSVYATIDPR